MTALIVWTLVALVAAGVVALVASATSNGADASFIRDLRAGLAARRDPRSARLSAELLDAKPVDVPLDEFLLATQVDDDGYLHVDELRDTLGKAKLKAVRSVHELTRRPV
ncbi:hypothetical protein ACWFNE_14645 [Cellulomonas sp. NPDC055163]